MSEKAYQLSELDQAGLPATCIKDVSVVHAATIEEAAAKVGAVIKSITRPPESPVDFANLEGWRFLAEVPETR